MIPAQSPRTTELLPWLYNGDTDTARAKDEELNAAKWAWKVVTDAIRLQTETEEVYKGQHTAIRTRMDRAMENMQVSLQWANRYRSYTIF